MDLKPPPGRRFPLNPIRYFEELALGDVFPLGAVRIDEADIIAFARQFDPQPFHLEPGTRLTASGWQIGALGARLACEGFLLGSACGVSPGIETARWYRPLYPGEWIDGAIAITALRPSRSKPAIGLVGIKLTLTDAAGDVLADQAQTILWGRRPDAAGGDA
jgi:acyl dehydratase